MRAPTVIAFLCIGLLRPHAALGQSVHWDPPGGTIAVGQTTTLQLVCEDCEPKDTPVPPRVDGLSLSYAGQASNMSFINGTYSHSISYTYAALLTKNDRIEIPSFEVDTNKGRVRVPSARFDPGTATVGNTGQSLESAANSRLEATPSSVWAGEVFDLGYSIQAARSYAPDFGHGVFDWNPEPLVIEDWSRPEPVDLRSGGEPQTGLVYRNRAIAPKSGSYRLNPVSQLINLSVSTSGFGFFQQRQYQQFSVTSTTPTLSVRPLPPAPAGFSGAVGNFKLASKIVPDHAAIGDPITWTIELSGTGNWPAIPGLPAREVSKDFQVIQPQAKRTPAGGKIFDTTLTEDVVLVPTREGTYELKPVHFICFNPKTGAYETLTAPGATVTVTAPPTASSGIQSAGPREPAAAAQVAVSSPSQPSGLPADPLPDTGIASSPRSASELAGLLLTPLLVVVAIWIWLARQRARQTDPERRRREARVRLAATLGSIRAGLSAAAPRPAALRTLLLDWQHDATELWGLSHAAPSSIALGDPAWSALWSEADRTLYGPDAPLPGDWVDRATEALSKKRVPGFASRRIFYPRNLLPFLFVAALAAGGALPSRADDASSYRRGDFAAAERGWRARVTAEPTAWAARHNLSLALAQQDRWDEAEAQAAAAFVQQPGNDSVRRQFELASGKAGFVPEALAGFMSPGPVAQLARLASPPDWELIAAAGAWLAGAALAALIAIGYGKITRGRTAAMASLGLGLALILAAGVARHAYGTAADSRAVMVWRNSTLRSVPTEADTAQKTVPLAAGSVARVDKRFLGWTRLAFDNGQTGWVRGEEIVWLWR